MNTLKFSHDYRKLPLYWDGTYAMLLGIFYVEDFSTFARGHQAFIRYDTTFRGEDGKYDLTGIKEAIILFLIHENTGQPFTTIRRFTPEKLKYYNGLTGKSLKLQAVVE